LIIDHNLLQTSERFGTGAAPTDLRRTSLMDNMFFIFVLEIRRVERTGLGAVAPSWQREASAVTHPNFLQKIDVVCGPPPSAISVRISCIRFVPSRRSTLPAGFALEKVHEIFRTSTMQVDSSITIIPPEPIIEPTSATDRNPPAYQSAIQDASTRRTSGLNGFELLPIRNSSSDIINDLCSLAPMGT